MQEKYYSLSNIEEFKTDLVNYVIDKIEETNLIDKIYSYDEETQVDILIDETSNFSTEFIQDTLSNRNISAELFSPDIFDITLLECAIKIQRTLMNLLGETGSAEA